MHLVPACDRVLGRRLTDRELVRNGHNVGSVLEIEDVLEEAVNLYFSFRSQDAGIGDEMLSLVM